MICVCYTILNSNASAADWPARCPHTVLTPAEMEFPVKIADRPILSFIANHMTIAVLTVIIFYLSLVTTSQPVSSRDRSAIDRAIGVLEAKGFEQEVFLLRHTATYRSTDHWLNSIIFRENAYAATNFPVQLITIYPDFYSKAVDDTERAMVLLHEAQHLKGADEHDAYRYVWQNRHRLGWTLLSHGLTPSFITIEQQTREHVPELFTCSEKVWNDCTETLQAKR